MGIARCPDALRPRLSGASEFGLRRGLFVLLLFSVAALSGWAGASDVLGQEVFDPSSATAEDGSGTTGWSFDDWPVEVILLATGVIVVTIIVFALVYQALLNSWYWPMNAYGISLFIIVTCSSAWAAFLFWEDLLDRIPAPIRWVQKYGGVMVLAVGWMLASAVIFLVCRSNRGRLAAR